ncbi:hypothetical protein ACVWWO_007318 [Bradyrhizobium sp. F1.13.1]
MSRSYQPCLHAIRNLGERALPVGASIVSRANVNLNILFIELPGEHGSTSPSFAGARATVRSSKGGAPSSIDMLAPQLTKKSNLVF